MLYLKGIRMIMFQLSGFCSGYCQDGMQLDPEFLKPHGTRSNTSLLIVLVRARFPLNHFCPILPPKP